MIPKCIVCRDTNNPAKGYCACCVNRQCLDCGHVVLNPCTCDTTCLKGSKFMAMDSPEAEAKAIREPVLNKFYFGGIQ
jgi:hypothetical protein